MTYLVSKTDNEKTILIPLVSSHGIISAAYASIIFIKISAFFMFLSI
jgi:hypothetical protein